MSDGERVIVVAPAWVEIRCMKYKTLLPTAPIPVLDLVVRR
ncbi:MAG TPA: hypothetical protein VNA57_02610 [Acidimicrobiales bacterium]|nr:hypothetical protein [Acidimicrobiales bacterium]